MALRLITPPAEEPVTLAEAKAHLRLEHSLDDDYVASLIRGARQYVEEVTWRALVTQTWELVLDGFPGWRTREILLPKGEVQSVTSVLYDDVNGVEQTFAPTEYVLGASPARLVLTPEGSWPNGWYGREDVGSVRVRFVAGYGSANAVPRPLKQACLMLVSQMYEHRTPEVVGTIVSEVRLSFDALISPYRLSRVL